MSVSRAHTWIANEILTAAELNAEFDNILSNGQAIGFPRTASADFDGQTLILDAVGDTTLRADSTTDIDIAIGAVDIYNLTATAMTINGIRFLTTGDLKGVQPAMARSAALEARMSTAEHDVVLAGQVFS